MPPITVSTWGTFERRSKCTPKIFSPARASSRLVAAPKPLDEPTISPQGVGPVSVIFVFLRYRWDCRFSIDDCRLHRLVIESRQSAIVNVGIAESGLSIAHCRLTGSDSLHPSSIDNRQSTIDNQA